MPTASARLCPPRTPRAPSLAAILAAMLAWVSPMTASGQIEDREPAWVVVTEPTAAMQCVDLRIYPVRTLRSGELVRIDGAGAEWVRVIYPDDQPAYVPAEAVRVDETAGTVTLREAHPLRAVNQRSPADSWRSLFDRATPLPAGTTLPLRGSVTGDADQIVGYLVTPPRPPEAPHQPHGYLPSGAVRPADAGEIARAMDRREDASRPADQTPPADDQDQGQRDDRPASTTPQQAEDQADSTTDAREPAARGDDASPDSDPSGTPDRAGGTPRADDPQRDAGRDDDDGPRRSDRQSGGVTAPPPAPDEVPVIDRPTPGPIDASRVDTSLLEPVVTPDVLASRLDLPGPDRGEAPDRDAAAGEPSAEVGATPQRLGPLTPAQLGERFEAFRSLDRSAQAESLNELINAFERTIATVERESVAGALRQRLEWLELQRDLRDRRRALEQILDEADDRTASIEQRLRALEETREYRFVGRLRPSALYNGRRLPRLYRLVAGGRGAAERTLAYIEPDEQGRAASLLDTIVGLTTGAAPERGPARAPGTPLVYSADRLVPLGAEPARFDGGEP